MENKELSKFRIKKKWHVDDYGDKKFLFYIQRKYRLVGWTYNDYKSINEFFFDLNFGVSFILVLSLVLSFMFLFFSFLSYIIGDPYFTVSPIKYLLIFYIFLIPGLIITITKLKSHKGKNSYITEEGAKKYIEKMIKKKVAKENLPEDETIFLNIQVERRLKLKKLNKKFKI